MKELIIDIYKVKDPYSGLGQFSLNFAKQIAASEPSGLVINFLAPEGKCIEIPNSKKDINFVNTNLIKRYLPSSNKQYSLWHSLYQFPSFLPGKSTKWILTIHDLNFLFEKNDAKVTKYLKRLQRNIDKADHITTISGYSKDQIEKNTDLKGKNVQVIYNGVASNTEIKNGRPGYIRSDKFFFSVGIFSRKKNFHVLIPLMKHFEDHQLILAGNNDTPYGNEIKEQIRQLHLEDKIILPGKIDEKEKYWLYAHCEAFLFPSMAEGFGMPPIEAMKAGKPVFLSRYASLPEIGGDKAFYFENFEETYMHKLILEKLNIFNKNPESFRNEIVSYADRFNWDRCISEYLKLYNHILSS